MPYRNTIERPPEDPPQSLDDSLDGLDGQWCTRCKATVPSTDDRCPRCLRRSSVVASRETVPDGDKDDGSASQAPPTVWPYTTACPICATSSVDDSVVYLRVAKMASGFGTMTASVIVKVRCCTACLQRIQRLEWARVASVVSMIAGLVLVLFLFVPNGSRVLGAFGALLVAGPFLLANRANRSLRAHLDSAGICERISLGVPKPSGLFEREFRVLHARAHHRKTVDLAELLEADLERNV